MKLIVRPEAEGDVAEGFNWYEDQLPGLGADFLETIEQQLERILKNPRAYPEVYPPIRRSLTERFPYAIFYLLEDAAVVVIAVSHQSQDAEHWKSRT